MYITLDNIEHFHYMKQPNSWTCERAHKANVVTIFKVPYTTKNYDWSIDYSPNMWGNQLFNQYSSASKDLNGKNFVSQLVSKTNAYIEKLIIQIRK